MDYLVVRSIMTMIVYTLSNYYTYQTGIEQGCNKPLKDIMHDILPDISHHVYVRDIALCFLFIPILWVKNKALFLFQLWEGFMILVTLKAITIFFTYCPPSNPDCQEKRYLNHCYHQMFSGHNSLALLLVMLYAMHGTFLPLYLLVAIMIGYSLLILMTRAHYTVDVVVSYIITWLLFV